MSIVRRSRADADLDRVDWARVAATGDVEIDAQVAADGDTAAVFTPTELERARWVVPASRPENVRAPSASSSD